MALIGLKNLYYAELTSDTAVSPTYGTLTKIGEAVSVDINPSVNKATLYGDDAPVAVSTSLTEISVKIETTKIPLEHQAKLLGHTYDSTNNTLTAKASDVAPYVGLAFESETHDGKTRCVKLLKGKFSLTQETINTRGENLEYQVPSLEGSFVARADGAWKKVKDFAKGTSTSTWYSSM